MRHHRPGLDDESCNDCTDSEKITNVECFELVIRLISLVSAFHNQIASFTTILRHFFGIKTKMKKYQEELNHIKLCCDHQQSYKLNSGPLCINLTRAIKTRHQRKLKAVITDKQIKYVERTYWSAVYTVIAGKLLICTFHSTSIYNSHQTIYYYFSFKNMCINTRRIW